MGDVGARRPAAGCDIAGARKRSGHPVAHKKSGSCRFGSGGASEERRAGGPRERRKGSDRAQPSFTTVRAAIDIGSEHPREEGLDRFWFGRCWRRRSERGPAGGQVLGAAAIGEEAVVPDAHETVGKDTEENADAG